MTLFWLSLGALIVGLALLRWIHSAYRMDIVVTPTQAQPPFPLISVCVPARNEERNISRCLEALLQQTYPALEVIVVDDRSTDSTPQILDSLARRDPRLRVLPGSELPPGWAGKPHALHQASSAARGEWLCFVDADTFLAPQALASCYQKALQTQADLFTILTHQELGTFWERVLMPLVLTAMSVGFPPRRVNDPRRRDAVANGQFILIRRAVYQALGGHAAIRDQIVEDKALAERVKWNGYRLVLADGQQIARTRMYRSLAEMWEGWTKNIYLGLRDRTSLLLLGALGATLALLAALVLPLWPVLGWLEYLRGGGWSALGVSLQGMVLWAALVWERARVCQALGIPRRYSLTTPLGAAIFAAIMLVSAWNVLSGRGVRWKGRHYLMR